MTVCCMCLFVQAACASCSLYFLPILVIAIMALTNEVKVEVGRVMESDDGVNVKITKLTKIFLDSGLARHEVVSPSLVLCHPSNRGGSMLNGHDVVQKGEVLMKQGVRQDLLEASSVAFCLSKQEDKRKSQVNANKILASHHPDLLAPPSGAERYLSVGSSHSTAYMRAMLSGILPETPLSKKDGPLKTCLHTGWRWLIIEDLVEEEFPSMPLLLASGLNSTNSVQVSQSEIEVLMTIGRYVSLHGMSVQQAKDKCLEAEPTCKDYIDVLAHFAARYGGGEGFPLLEFLGAFGKVYGASRVLGSVFMKAVTYCDFKVEGNLLPCLRVALLAAQITSPKAVDKVAQLLFKSDIEKLKNFKNKGPLVEAENLLKGCWDTVQAANVDAKQRMQAYGRCSVRVALFLCQKEKEGREGQEMGSLAEISKAFGMELLGMSSGPASSSTDSAPVVENMLTATFTDVVLKQHKHLHVGGSFVHKDHGNKIFVMVGVEDDKVVFQHQSLLGEPMRVQVPASAELGNWKKTKRVQPVVLDAVKASGYTVSASRMQAEAFELGQAQLELYREFIAKHDDKKDISFVTPPSGLLVTAPIRKGALSLVAFGQLTIVKEPSKVKDGVWVGTYLLQGPKVVSDFEKLDDKSLLVPFWYVRATNEKELVNMTFVHKELGSLKVPSYLNRRDLAPGELLYCASDSLIAKEAQSSAPAPPSPVKRLRTKGPGTV